MDDILELLVAVVVIIGGIISAAGKAKKRGKLQQASRVSEHDQVRELEMEHGEEEPDGFEWDSASDTKGTHGENVQWGPLVKRPDVRMMPIDEIWDMLVNSGGKKEISLEPQGESAMSTPPEPEEMPHEGQMLSPISPPEAQLSGPQTRVHEPIASPKAGLKLSAQQMRNAVVMSEILGRPKALQGRQQRLP